jgi:anti-sigma factor RsiW
MNCNDATSRAYDYFERKLSNPERAAVEAHVAACASCGELWNKAREMTCRDFGEGCGELSEATLSPERARLFERHLSICRACADYLASYQRTIAIARTSAQLDDASLTALEDRLIETILEARKRRA